MFIKCNISCLKGLENWDVSNGKNFSLCLEDVLH